MHNLHPSLSPSKPICCFTLFYSDLHALEQSNLNQISVNCSYTCALSLSIRKEKIRNSLDHTKFTFDFPDKRPLVDIQPQVTNRFRNVNIETTFCNFFIIKRVMVMMTFMVMTTLYWHTNLLKLGERVKALCLVILYDMYLWGERRTWLSKTGKSISSDFINLTTWFLWLNLTRKQRLCMSRMGFLLL